MRKPYHLTITDNRTGEVHRDTDINAIICAFHLGDNETGQVFLSNCPGRDLGQLMIALVSIREQVFSEIPELGLLMDTVETHMRQVNKEYSEEE